MATTSRPSYVAAIYLVACCTIAFADEPPAKDDKSKPPAAMPRAVEVISKETAASPAAAAEQKKLVGSWYVVEHVQQNDAGAKILKLVVTPKTFFFADTGSSYPLIFQYRLDPSKSPKRLDLGYATMLDHSPADFGDPLPSIYELDGNALRISNGERDDSGNIQLRAEMLKVEPGVKRELLIMKRCSDIAALPLKTSKEVDAEILKALDVWIAHLAAKEYEKFHDSASARLEPFRASEFWNRALDELLLTLRAAKRLTPTMSDDGKQAVYDLMTYHIDGVETVVLPKLQLVRKDDTIWKLEGF